MLWLKTSGRAREHGSERLLLHAEEVRRQHLDGRLGQLGLEGADRRREVARTSIGEVVAVDGRDDDVLQSHRRRGLGEAERLQRVGRRLGLAGGDVAVAARSRAGVAEDLEGRRATAPALTDVRAASLLADRHEARAVQQLADVVVPAVGARRADLHPLGPPRSLGDGEGRPHRSQCTGRGRGTLLTGESRRSRPRRVARAPWRRRVAAP